MRDIDNGISIRCKDILRDMKYKLENGYIMQEIEINNIIQEIKNDDEYSQHNELIE